MTRAALRHVPMTMDRVQLTLTGDDGRSVTATVEGAYLRAKAWGMLADLDPGGLMDAALGQRTAPIRGEVAGLALTSRIVLALADGPRTNEGIRLAICDTSIPAVRLKNRCGDLIRQGLVYRSDGNDGPGRKAIYALTDAGKRRAANLDQSTAGRAAA